MIRHVHIHTHDKRGTFKKNVSVTALRPGQRIAVNGKVLKVRHVELSKNLLGEEEYHIATTTGEVVPVRPHTQITTFDADGLAVRRHTLHGFHISIESPRGSIRRGSNWAQSMPADYGFIEDMKGADGDSLDCYVGPQPTSQLVYVVDQNFLDGRFDEHKCIFGCRTMDEAKKLYMAGHHQAEEVFRGIREFGVPEFRQWVTTGDMTKPCAEYREGFYGGG